MGVACALVAIVDVAAAVDAVMLGAALVVEFGQNAS